jgi:hypothetical protein
MRTKVTIGLFFLSVLISRTAWSDTIGLYSDPSGASCNFVVTPFAVTDVYAVHVTDGATASMFLAQKPACWTGAAWLGDTTPYCAGVGCGDSQTGIALVYGTCRVGAIHVLTIRYFAGGASESCCPYPLLPHPWSQGGHVEVVDCDFNPGVAFELMATVNGGPECPCGYPVPVEEKTWGQVKALYSE